MNQFSFDILLEFLYNKFATTLMFCLFGSFVREYLIVKNIIKTDSNSKNVGKLNPGKVVISAIFSTILMCACADYVKVSLNIEVYAILSVVLGVWGLDILKALLDKNILKKFFKSVTELITDPLIKKAVESATEALEQESDKISDEEQQSDETDEENINEE